MARKKKHPEHVNHERWLVSYADFITLLFAFFVVMFAASNADQKKAGQIANAVQVAFHELAVFSPSSKVVPLVDGGGFGTDSKRVIGSTATAFDAAQIVAAAQKTGQAPAELSEVKKQLETVLKAELSEHSVRILEDSRGLTISLGEAGFFNPGSALMQPKAVEVVDRIAATLLSQAYNVRVEGHTDNTPIHTAQFPSNWELSTARATNVLQHLISRDQIPPQRLSAVGYGEYRPVASNDDAQGRSYNRRVDLVVIGNVAQKLEPQADPSH